jgi:transposase
MKDYIGIDIGKYELDVFDGHQFYKYTNDEKGIKKIILKLKNDTLKNTFVVFEATGGYEKLLTKLLSQSNIPFKRIHPNKIRHYAKAIGYSAKTDKIDSKLIWVYASNQKLEKPDILMDEEDSEIKELLGRREQLLADKVSESNRLDKLANPVIIKSIKKHIKWINKELEVLEKSLNELIKKNAKIQEKIKLYKTIKGIGSLTAVYIATHLPELGAIENNSLAALVGVAPMNRDSGKKKGKRAVQAGRSKLRNVLYMAALSAIRFNNDIKVFYQRLMNKGKLFKVAITAAMRKLILMANSVARRGTPWQATRVLV